MIECEKSNKKNKMKSRERRRRSSESENQGEHHPPVWNKHVVVLFYMLVLATTDAFATSPHSSSPPSSSAASTTTTSSSSVPNRMPFLHRGGSLSPKVRGNLSSRAVSLAPTDTATTSASTTTSSEPQEHDLLLSTTTQSVSSLEYDEEQEQALLQDELVQATFVADTKLPTELGHFRLRAYRIQDQHINSPASFYGGTEPCVIYAKEHPPPFTGDQPPLIRVHDQCMTSEVFGSQRCDCRDQLRMAMAYIRKHGGAVIYLQQEGRGIGLANKVAAYALQDDGMDTVDANLHLGFPADCRQYGVLPSILKDLGIPNEVRLLTNNPRKVERLERLGIHVTGTVPMVVERANRYNRKYLETKQDRMRHTNFQGMLAQDMDNAVMMPRKSLTHDFIHKTGIHVPTEEKNHQVDDYLMDHANHHPLQISRATHVDSDDDDEQHNVQQLVSPLIQNEHIQEGVVARQDGYCFGRQSVVDAINAMAQGEMVCVVDDMNRENEGDFIMAADLCTPQAMAKIVRHSSGVVCVGMEGDRMDALKLPAMVQNNEDPKGTAFSVTVDASKEKGITTGISAKDRSITIQLLAQQDAVASDFSRPGHIFPLRARDGGVLTRDGHTEAAVDLSRLAGRAPVGVLCEIVSEENPTEMARLPELKRFCQKHGYVLTSIVDLQQYIRDEQEKQQEEEEKKEQQSQLKEEQI